MAILVHIREDSMEATVEIERSSEELLEAAAIAHALAEAGLRYGIDADACNNLVGLVNQLKVGERISHSVAHGTPPVDGKDGKVELAVDYFRSPVGRVTEHDAIDFHEHGSYTPIAKDQLIARIVLPTEGTLGQDVRGRELRQKPGARPPLRAGKGTKLEADGTELHATQAGDLVCSGDLIEIIDIIRTKGNIDYTTGNIECESSVHVQGDVLSGFHIRAGGDVVIEGVVNSASVSSNGSITIKQGVLPGSTIHAAKNIGVVYVREAYLEAGASVTILKEAVQSTIVSGDTITFSDGSRVIGGRSFAQKRIVADVAGHPNGVPTALIAGVDALKELRTAKLKAVLNKATSVYARVDKLKGLAKPEYHDPLDDLLSHAAKRKENSAEELAQLKGEENVANCRISGRLIHPQVLIRIGPDEVIIKERSQNVTFYYDSNSGQIVQVGSKERK